MFTLMSRRRLHCRKFSQVGADSSSLLLSDTNPVICLVSSTLDETLATVIISFCGPYKGQQSSQKDIIIFAPSLVFTKSLNFNCKIEIVPV